MTNEKAIKMLEYIRHTGNGESEYKNDAQAIAIDMAIKALEQNSILDKIRAEIEEHIKINQNLNTDRARALCWCLDVIDKCRAENGDKE